MARSPGDGSLFCGEWESELIVVEGTSDPLRGIQVFPVFNFELDVGVPGPTGPSNAWIGLTSISHLGMGRQMSG